MYRATPNPATVPPPKGNETVPTADDLAVGLDRDARPGGPRPGAEVGEDLAARAERLVSSWPVRVYRARARSWKKLLLASKPEVVPSTTILPSGWMATPAAVLVVAGCGGGDDLAAGAEAGVEAAVAGLVARQGEVPREGRRVLDRPRHDDRVGAGLQGDARDGGDVRGTEAGDDLAAGAERGVEAAVRC